MEKYFSGDTLSNDEIISGLRSALLNCDIFPILVGSATKNMGLKGLLDKICKYLPSPADLKPANGINPKTNKKYQELVKMMILFQHMSLKR